MHRRTLLLITSLAMLRPKFALAAGADWVVSKATKQVKYTINGRDWTPVVQGQQTPNEA